MSSRPETALGQIFEDVPLGLAWLTPDGEVISANAAAAPLFEGTCGTAVRRAVNQLIERAAQGARLVECALSLGALGEARLLLSTGDDGALLTIERGGGDRLRGQNNVLRTLLAALVESLPPNHAIERALATLSVSLSGSAAAVYQLDEAGTRLTCVARVAGPSGPPSRSLTMGLDDSAPGHALTAGRPIMLSNLARSPFEADRLVPYGERYSLIALPVKSRGVTIGVIEVVGPAGLLAEGELRLVLALADAAGALLDRARQEASAAAERSAREVALSSLDDAYLEMDADGRLVVVSGRVTELFGLPPAQLVGRKLDEWLAPRDVQRFQTVVSSAIRLGHASGEIHLTGGGERALPCVISAGTAHVGTQTVVRAVVRGLGTRLALEADVRRARDAAAQQDHLARIGTLASGVAHEINNPLSYVKVNLTEIVSTLEREVSGVDDGGVQWSREDLLTMAREASSGVDRIVSIVKALNGMTRNKAEDDVLFDAERAVADAITIFQGARRREVQVSYERGTMPQVQGSPAALGQIVLNLLSNGLDAMGGTGALRVRATREGDSVCISVVDTGTGIPADVRDRIFEPFFTTKEVGRGTGLGLYVCRELSTRLHGRLEFATGTTGTTFTLILPIPQGVRAERTPMLQAVR